MTDKIDLAAMYAAALPQRTRENLLAQYCDYISLVRNLENVVRRYKPAQLAAYQINNLFSKEDENPWSVEKTDRDERAAYDSFVANEPPAPDTHYCFVSLNRTSPRFAGEGPGIFSMPESFATYGVSHSLPARVERCVAAFRKEEKLASAIRCRRGWNGASPLSARKKSSKTPFFSSAAVGKCVIKTNTATGF